LLEKLKNKDYIKSKIRRYFLQDQTMKQGKTTAFFKSASIIADSYAFARITNFCRISSIII